MRFFSVVGGIGCWLVSAVVMHGLLANPLSSALFRLDALEREEEIHQTRMRKIAQVKAKPPIGVVTSKAKGPATSAISTTQVDLSVIEPQPRPRIWNNLAPETPRSEAQSSMMLDDSDSLEEHSSLSSSMSSTQL